MLGINLLIHTANVCLVSLAYMQASPLFSHWTWLTLRWWGGNQSWGVAYRWKVKVGHVHHAQNVVHTELVLRIGQLHRGHQVAHGGHDGLKTV